MKQNSRVEVAKALLIEAYRAPGHSLEVIPGPKRWIAEALVESGYLEQDGDRFKVDRDHLDDIAKMEAATRGIDID